MIEIEKRKKEKDKTKEILEGKKIKSRWGKKKKGRKTEKKYRGGLKSCTGEFSVSFHFFSFFFFFFLRLNGLSVTFRVLLRVHIARFFQLFAIRGVC